MLIFRVATGLLRVPFLSFFLDELSIGDLVLPQPVTDDPSLAAAVAHAAQEGCDKIHINIIYPIGTPSAAADGAMAMAATGVGNGRRAQSAPNSPKSAAMAAASGGSLAFATPIVVPTFGPPAVDALAPAPPLPAWTDLLPDVISFFEDHHVQQVHS